MSVKGFRTKRGDQKYDYDALDNKPEEKYTTAEKTKLAGIETQANKTVIDDTLTQTGEAADAKATGDAIGTINSALTSLSAVTEIIDTASGAIASFPDGSGLPMRSLLAQINPVQDLHGQDAPYPAGGGKNLVPMTTLDDIKSNNTSGTWNGADYSRNGITFTVLTDNAGNVLGFKLNGTSTAGASFQVKGTDDFTLAAGTYYYTGVSETSGGYDLNLRKTGTTTDITQRGSTVTLTLEEDTSFHSMYIWVNSGNTLTNVYVYPMIRNSSVSDATFAPYSNICPISGWTGVQGQRTGFNIWDEVWEVGGYSTTTGEKTQEQRIRNKNKIAVFPGQKIYLKLWNGATNDMRLFYYDKHKAFIECSVWLYPGEVTIPNNCYFIAFSPASSYGTTYHNDISINYPSTDTEYHAYTGEAISVSFGQTVYGGTDEVVSVNGKSTMGMVDLGTLTWEKNDSSLIGVPCFYATVTGIKQGAALIACSQYKVVRERTNINASGMIAIGNHTDATYVVLRDDAYASADATAFKTAMSGVQLCYELATPTTFTHTGQSVSTLVGQNNVWVDTGDVEVTYQASIKGYIDKVLGQ